MQKLLNRFSQNSVERWHMARRRNDYILVITRIWNLFFWRNFVTSAIALIVNIVGSAPVRKYSG